jgi:hypothetical protein
MRTRILNLWIFLSFGACTTGRIQDDLAAVRRVTRVDLPRGLTRGEVHEESAAEVRAMLQRPLDADGLAMANNRHLRASLRELGVPRGGSLQAGTLPNPRSSSTCATRPTARSRSRATCAVEFGLTRAILTGQRAGVARAELEAAQARVAGTVLTSGSTCARPSTRAGLRGAARGSRSRRSTPSPRRATPPARSTRRATSAPSTSPVQEAAYETARSPSRDRARAPRPPRAPPAPARAPRRGHRVDRRGGAAPPRGLALDGDDRDAARSEASLDLGGPARQPRALARRTGSRAPRAGCPTSPSTRTPSRTATPWRSAAGRASRSPSSTSAGARRPRTGRSSTGCWSATTAAPSTCARRCATRATGCARRTPARGSTTP